MDAAVLAAKKGHLECLKYILEVEPKLLQGRRLIQAAAEGGSLPCITFLIDVGYQWGGDMTESAARSANPAALRYCLEHAQPASWPSAMTNAVSAHSPECMRVLYDHGYHAQAWSPHLHPAVLAVKHRSMPCLRLALQMSGPPDPRLIDTADAASHSEEMLRCVVELGAALGPCTPSFAARKGNRGALRYALEAGAPWDRQTYEGAIYSDSLECLKCAHQHEGRGGGGSGATAPKLAASRNLYREKAPVAVSLPVLWYVCEHMDGAFAQEVLWATAIELENNVSHSRGQAPSVQAGGLADGAVP
jgi:hypothetical protein